MGSNHRYTFSGDIELNIETDLPLTDAAAVQRAESLIQDAIENARGRTASGFIGNENPTIEVLNVSLELDEHETAV